MGTNCAHLVADLFLFCYERDFTCKVRRPFSLEVSFNKINKFIFNQIMR